MNNLIEVKNISFSYDGHSNVLSNISFNLRPKESLGILGPNGGGKTTLLKIILGLLSPQSGSIHYQEQNLFSYVPQKDNINTLLPLTVKEVVEQANLLRKNPKLISNVDKILETVGILNKKNSLIKNLSGGERQRVLIARALNYSPKVLVLDEPNKGLDSTGQDQLFDILEKIKSENSTSIIIVDHNLNQIIKHSNKIICLNKSLHWHDKKELLTKNVLEKIYHCEFEHLKIHDEMDTPHDHHLCKTHGDHNHNHGGDS